MRKRQKLEVSTFPFLAVLLCAMGSLILLLLVMDRRAKIAARARAREAYLARLAKIDDDAKRRTDEAAAAWNLQKQKLNEVLKMEDESIRIRQSQLAIAVAQIARDLGAGKSKLAELERRLEDEQRRFQQDRDDLERFRLHVQSSIAGKAATSSQEAVRLARELQQLERLWTEMKRHRAQPRDVFSLVPFKGKLGQKRTPVYVECVHGAVAVHPRKTLVPIDDDFDVARFRKEVEDRSASLVKATKNASPLDTPHVLFLVRPDGISSYHAAKSALSGFSIDFGYELVDAAWVFDFDPNAQPTRTAWTESPQLKIEPSTVQPGSRTGIGVSLSTPRPHPSIGEPDETGFGPKGSNAAKSGSTQNAAAPGTTPGNAAFGPLVNSATRPSGPSIGLLGALAPPRPVVGAGPSGSASIGFQGGSNVASVGTGSGKSLAQRSSVPSLFTGDTSKPSGNPVAPTGGPPSLGAPRSTPADKAPSTGGTEDPRRENRPKSPDEIAASSASSKEKTPGSVSETPAPQGSTASDGSPSEGGASSSDPNSKEPFGQPDPLGSKQPPNPLRTKQPPLAAKKSLPPIGRLIANRDFQVIVKCLADRVEVIPGGLDYDMADANAAEIDRELASSVRKMVDRRLATVRPGESPYRPNIRFQVHPEGLRTYLRIYPLMEQLNLPMTRENLEP